MFDIGFAELVIIAIVGLLVIGPERLPGTVRTIMAWVSRLRRGFNEIKTEVQQELHNDQVMQELRRTGEQLKDETEQIGREFNDVKHELSSGVALQDDPPANHPATGPETTSAEKRDEA